MNIIGIIPARYASTRFPAKALAMINGKSMIQYVFERASQAKSLSDVIIATDNELIADNVLGFGGKVIMTNPNHPSGTDRVYEAVSKLENQPDVVINIQGDEPFIDPAVIDALAEAFNDSQVEIASMTNRINNAKDIFDPNIVKVVIDARGKALYFSRNPIPYARNIPNSDWITSASYFKHIGIYGYRTDILKQIVQLPVSSLEKAESLEQLRWLEAGYYIRMIITEYESFGIDTKEDLEKALKNL